MLKCVKEYVIPLIDLNNLVERIWHIVNVYHLIETPLLILFNFNKPNFYSKSQLLCLHRTCLEYSAKGIKENIEGNLS